MQHDNCQLAICEAVAKPVSSRVGRLAFFRSKL